MRSFFVCVGLAAGGCASNVSLSGDGGTVTGTLALTVAPVSVTAAGKTFSSSTQFALQWTAVNAHHFEARATSAAGSTVVVRFDSAATQGIANQLAAATEYTVTLAACADEACASSPTATGVGKTGEEVWQIQGSGEAYATATKVITDGNTLSYAFRYGSEAGALAGYTRYYYNPSFGGGSGFGPGVRPAKSTSAGADLASVSTFVASDSGIKGPCDDKHLADCPKSGALFMRASQGVPLKRGGVRMFFEAEDLNSASHTPRHYFLDSQDGYLGEDFNPLSTSTVCGGNGSTDYQATGACAPTLTIGLQGDSTLGDSGLIAARQAKIGYPTRTSWLWDEAPGTFQVITGADACKKSPDGLFYATWDGLRWNTVKDSGGCARLFVAGAHGPVIVHLGEGRYKLYFEHRPQGGTPGPQANKPLHMVYADATRTGDPNVVDFDDWELETASREVHFLWPTGKQLDEAEESGLGDHFVYAPDSLASQFMYVNLGGFDNLSTPTTSQGIGIAVLLNP